MRREAFLGRPRLRCADGEVEERRHGVVTLHVRIAVGHGTHAQASGAQRADARQDIGEEVGARLMANARGGWVGRGAARQVAKEDARG